MAKCYFNSMWLIDFSWVKEVPNDKYSAYCSLCSKKINLSNMGRRALISHQKTNGHQKKEDCASKNTKLTFGNHPVVNSNAPEIGGTQDCSTQLSTISEEGPSTVVTTPSPSVVHPGIQKYMIKEKVRKAEIKWCLQAVATHKSLRSAEKDSQFFSELFEDSETAKLFQLGRDKMTYILIFGIVPFIKDHLMKELLMCEHVVIGFDESLNKVSQKQQMDLNVRYWSSSSNEVKTRYLNSAFLGRSCAEHLLAGFQEASKPINLKKLLQVSMDGPNTNLKFLKELSAHIKEAPEDPQILNMGSCGLHAVNLAFKTGARSTGWEIFDFMRALYYVFKDSPARRALYTHCSNSTDFPLKFCGIRWLENSNVAERCQKILPNVKKFIHVVEKEKKAPTSKSYVTVKKLINDPLLSAQLAFFVTIANEFENFLRDYQTDAPLVPFLFSDLTSLYDSLMKRFLKKDALKEGNLLNVELDKSENFLELKKIDVGISALCSIKKAKTTESQVNAFYRDARKFLIASLNKLKDRSPLSYALTRAASSLNPEVAVNENLFAQRLTKLLLTFCENNWMTSSVAEKAKMQLTKVCSENVLKLQEYQRTERIDKFWYNLLSTYSKPCDEAISLIKMTMILSHGNSNVERGFSINKSCLWDNMNEESLVARRVVFDYIQDLGGVSNVEITKQLILSVKNARGRFEEHKEKKRKEEKDMSENLKRKRETENQLKELQAKKIKIMDEAQKERLKVEEEIASLKLMQKKL